MRVEIEEGLSKPNGKWCSDLISKSFVRIGSCTLHMWLLQAHCWCAGMSWCIISAWVQSNECSSSRNYWIVQFSVEFQRENAVQKSIQKYLFTTLDFNENSLEFLFDFLQSITQMQLPCSFNLITLHFIAIQSTKIVMKKKRHFDWGQSRFAFVVALSIWLTDIFIRCFHPFAK